VQKIETKNSSCRNGRQFVSTFNDNLTELGCNSSEKVAIVVHGWLESIDAEWPMELIENLRQYRGGCIIFMDYSNHSIVNDYFILVRKFNPIEEVLLQKLKQLEEQGFKADNMFMYGFSFGAQLVMSAGMLFGQNKIAEIDGSFQSFFLMPNFY
jgi:Lipase